MGFSDQHFCSLVIFGLSMRLGRNGAIVFEDFILESLGPIAESLEVQCIEIALWETSQSCDKSSDILWSSLLSAGLLITDP